MNGFTKQPKAPTTAMPTFDVKSGEIELLGDTFQTSLKIQKQLTEKKPEKLVPLSHAWGCGAEV